MKHLPLTLALICVALTVIAFPAIVSAAETSSLDSSKKIELPNGVSLEMVKVEAGTFEMSVMNGIKSGFGEVAHPATLTQDFFIGKTEVTQAQWKEIMGENPVAYFSLSYSVIGDNLPVVEVSWSKAMEFCEKLNATGKAPNGWKFTLPTETQWEYAARGGNKSKGYKYSGSNNIDEVAWYYGNSGDRKLDDSSFSLTLMESNNCRPHPVGQKKANELGLYDMSGNVYEWCLDDWQDKSDTLKAEFSRENDRGKSSRTIRGGAFLYSSELSHPARRNIGHNGDRSNFTGFRLALVQTSSEKGEEKNTPAIQDKIPEKTAQKIDLPGGVSIEMVKVEAGTFIMGAKDGYNYPNEVQRRVTLKLDYLIGKTEITQAQWKAVMGNNPSRFQGDDLPVENITWDDAMAFCEKLNTMSKAPSGWTFTLPTETQWEYAARGGNKSRGYIYSGSNNAGEVAWYSDPLFKTHPIGQKTANELGLYDMSGNVSEWCLDNDDVPDGFRSVRGGSSSERKTMDIRVARRLALAHDWHLESNGFRLALVPTQK